MLVLVTDGQIGHEDRVLAGLGRYLERIRVFTVGVDRAVNAGFLRRLAGAGRGRCELVESEDALDEAMTRIHRAVTPPLVKEVTAELQGAQAEPAATVPARPPDCYPGPPTVISGRYQGQPTAVVLTGSLADGSPWRQVVETTVVHNPAVRTTWARAHVRALEDRYVVGGADELAAEIVRVSLAHRVLSRFTAFVAVDSSDPTGSRAPLPVVQPVELPAGWAGAGPGATAVGAAAPVLTRARSRTERAVHAGSAPSWTEVVRLLEGLLDRLDGLVRAGGTPSLADREALADELADLDDRLRDPSVPAGVREAVAALARAVRTWDAVPEKADQLRRRLGLRRPRPRARLAFWR